MEGAPPYDKGSAIATLTAVMTENLEEPKNAGPLRDVIFGLLNKDPAQRLDDAGARAMLNKVIHAPDRAAETEPADATKVVPLPAQPDERTRRGGSAGAGGRRGEEAGERLRGALRSVRKAAVGAGAAGAAAAPRTKQGGSGRSASGGPGASAAPGTAASGSAGTAAAAASRGPGATAPATGSGVGAGAGAGVGSGHGGSNAPAGTRSSGWPVVPPPDLPPRPCPGRRSPTWCRAGRWSSSR